MVKKRQEAYENLMKVQAEEEVDLKNETVDETAKKID